ncbi:MAG: 4-hydroxy-tetrahydrodipicolinate synthase [Lautropia sp.]|nr:4-hydroxy-tetrahydrodipicolinate synthase [Lautropia sp.]
MKIKGSLVAVVSPMKADGSLDFDAYRNLLDWHIESGTSAIVAVGTTGESPTVSVQEHVELIRVAAEHCRGRIPLIAGTGGNSTREAIELTRHAFEVGVDASLQVAPYYNKPSQEGLFRHFTTVAQEGGLPVILYNVPGRTVADISNATVLRLADNPNIIGIKDATGDVGRGASLMARLPERFAVYSGNDDSALALIAMGADGVISVTANVAPRQMAEMCAAALDGDFVQAREINRRLMPLHERLFAEPNPVPAKWALARLNRIASPAVRLPLSPLSPSGQAAVLDALQSSGVLV